MNEVYLVPCDSYQEDEVRKAYEELLIKTKLLDFIKPGDKIAIKVNLVSALKPDKAATTNPILVKLLAIELIKRGAIVTIGDSPGGLFNSSALNHNYKETMMTLSESVGATLNQNFEQCQRSIEGHVVKTLDCSNWLLENDYIINFCKLKSHGMMGLSASVKNMFGSVPGLLKPEYHYRYTNHRDFAAMLIDIHNFYKPVINIVDAIVSMEGNGPTQGSPRKVGLLLASSNAFNLDIVCSRIINIDPYTIPTIIMAKEYGLSDNEEDIKTNIDYKPYIVKDYKNIKLPKDMEFNVVKKGPFKKLVSGFISKVLTVKPKLKKKECIGCKKCYNVCPAKAITMVKGKPKINRDICIRCFCCQEFCPTGAMKAHKNPIVRMLNK